MSSGVPSVPWHEFPVDPRRPDAAALRASDRDRDLICAVLVDACADGRLTREEYDERLERAAAARTLGQLPPLVADLVPMTPVPTTREAVMLADSDGLHRQAVTRFQERRRQALVAFLLPTLICWAVWIASASAGSGSPFPWPVFVMLGTGGNALRVLLSRATLVAEEQRRLERRLQRQVERQRRRLGGPGSL